ncbi:MAG: hypothetical protein WCC70_11400, partial [Candidatus Aquilonibacter sp.]
MAFWSGEKLKERLPALITDGARSIFDDKSVDCAAYRLSVGHEVYISPTIDSSDRETRTIRRLEPEESLVIPPGQFAFLITSEVIQVPKDAIAFISMRAKIKFRGLVNVSGFHVDPGYIGQLTFAVYNAGPVPVHLKQGEQCFLIWYADLDRQSAITKTDPPSLGIKSELVSSMSGSMESLDGLSKRIDKIESWHNVYQALFGVLITIFIGVFLLVAGIFVKQWWNERTATAPP